MEISDDQEVAVVQIARHIRWLFHARDHPEAYENKVEQIRSKHLQNLYELIEERGASIGSETNSCFGVEYAPVPRAVINGEGHPVPNPDYEPSSLDICGRDCWYGLWKTELTEGETQGNSYCLFLQLFALVVGFPLPSCDTQEKTIKLRLDLLHRVFSILEEEMQGYVLQPGQKIHEGFVLDTNTNSYVLVSGTNDQYVTADMVIDQPPPPPPQPAPARPAPATAPPQPQPTTAAPPPAVGGGLPAPPQGLPAATPAAAPISMPPATAPVATAAPATTPAPTVAATPATAPAQPAVPTSSNVEAVQQIQIIKNAVNELEKLLGVGGDPTTSQPASPSKPPAGAAIGEVTPQTNTPLIQQFIAKKAEGFAGIDSKTLKSAFTKDATDEELAEMARQVGLDPSGWNANTFRRTAASKISGKVVQK